MRIDSNGRNPLGGIALPGDFYNITNLCCLVVRVCMRPGTSTLRSDAPSRSSESFFVNESGAEKWGGTDAIGDRP
jgi:hypothetical protein